MALNCEVKSQPIFALNITNLQLQLSLLIPGLLVPAEKCRELGNLGIGRLNNSSKLFHQKLVKFNRELRNSGIRSSVN